MDSAPFHTWLQLSPSEWGTTLQSFRTTKSIADWRDLFDQGVLRIRSLLHEDGADALALADLLYSAAVYSPEPSHAPLAARMKAQVLLICFGRYDEAAVYYDEALTGYENLGDDFGRAKVESTHIWLLALTDLQDEAFQRGRWALSTLAELKEWEIHAMVCNNLSSVYHVCGYTRLAFDVLGEVNLEFLKELDLTKALAVDANRALYLQELGRYAEAIELMERVIPAALENPNTRITGANLKHNLALTYIKMGHYSTALRLLDDAFAIWQEDKRYADMALSQLVKIECFYQLRRFADVLQLFADLKEFIRTHDVLPEKLFSFTNEARAYMALHQYEEASASLKEMKRLLNSANRFVLLHFELIEAEILFVRQSWSESRLLAASVAERFMTDGHQFAAVTALILAAQCCLEAKDTIMATGYLQQAEEIAVQYRVPSLLYKIYGIKGVLFEDDSPQGALAYYQAAIQQLERLQSHIMSEFRPDFMLDAQKQRLYERSVSLLVANGEITAAWRYVERAKSRALLDILQGRINLQIKAKSEADERLVQELNDLRQRRNELTAKTNELDEEQDIVEALQEAERIEQQSTELWHRLLLRNTAYGRSAAIYQTPQDIQVPFVDRDVSILEYFLIDQRFVAFVLCFDDQTDQTVVHQVPLSATVQQINQLHRQLFLNIQLLTRNPKIAENPQLQKNIQGVLYRLYQALIEPCLPYLGDTTRWRIIPHGVLHYFPFDAFFDGAQYLVERAAISYLPSVDAARNYVSRAPQSELASLVVGHSYQGQLPFAVSEAEQISDLCQADLLINQEVTHDTVTQQMSGQQLIHIATHGEFRHDNPLFSGLALEDGWLTTLDIFHLDLDASLVTLSACNTGRSLISGGDELIGISRAFLTAGAASLLLSHWPVDDHSTALLMKHFYHLVLHQNQPKDRALQQAKIALIHGILADSEASYQHPFFWSPFFLVGANGNL